MNKLNFEEIAEKAKILYSNNKYLETFHYDPADYKDFKELDESSRELKVKLEIKAIAELMKEDKHLECFKSYYAIGASGVIEIAEACKVNTAIKRLILCGANIKARGAVAIAELLKVNTSLMEINLERNFIGDDGAVILAEGLKNNNSLRVLDLQANEITDKGAIAIAQALKNNHKFWRLNLSRNSIRRKGRCAFIPEAISKTILQANEGSIQISRIF